MFVLLEHDTPAAGEPPSPARPRHWDLLIEVSGQELLATWQLAHNPIQTASDIPARRIPDHRRRYLDYEGEIGRGRGLVHRLDRGPAAVERLAGDELTVLLSGQHLRGRFEIVHITDETAVFRATQCQASG